MVEIPVVIFGLMCVMSFACLFFCVLGLVIYGCEEIEKKEEKKKRNLVRPTHWCISWGGTVELGFADGTYLPRVAALILYPEYFDKNGEPILESLPMDKGEKE